jgi:3-hydroxyisobutyrate dehydrogenase-like beta-hydroxyacid dehydrogenase
MAARQTIGFIGTGVMGEPMCRNLAAKSGARVVAYDANPEPLARLAAAGVEAMAGVAPVAQAAEVVFLCLPGAPQVRDVCLGAQGLAALARPGQTVVDMSTSTPALAREIAQRLSEKGASFADAPVARTREAAQSGTLSIMVGGDAAVVERIRPYLACMGSDITHCGPVGAGEVVKLINNMIVCQNVIVAAGALALGERSGIDGKLLLETLAKGSADSFVLRNHAIKSLLPKTYPERAFSVEYMLKDLGYALDVARETGLKLESAELAQSLYRAAVRQGVGGRYFPVVRQVIEKDG